MSYYNLPVTMAVWTKTVSEYNLLLALKHILSGDCPADPDFCVSVCRTDFATAHAGSCLVAIDDSYSLLVCLPSMLTREFPSSVNRRQAAVLR